MRSFLKSRSAAVLPLMLLAAGCTNSKVEWNSDGELGKADYEKTVADFASEGRYEYAEKLAKANLSGGKHPVRNGMPVGADESYTADIPPSPPEDETMHLLNLASVLLLEGKKNDAHEKLDRAAQKIEEQYDQDSQALKLTHGEKEKFFKGDGYERATMYAFLAMSFLERGEYEKARKYARRGIAADSDAEHGEHRFDYALLPYVGYLAAAKDGSDEAAGFDDIVMDICGFRPSKHPFPEALVAVWTGGGTLRALGGEFGEIRYVRKGSLEGVIEAAAVESGGMRHVSLPGLADLNYQAATRGGRIMDHVLDAKATVKRGLVSSGNFLLAFGAACFVAAGSSQDGLVAVSLCAVGGVSVLLGCPTHLFGMMVSAEADARCWSVLPGRLLIVPVHGMKDNAVLHGYRGWDEVWREELPAADLAKPEKGIKVLHYSLQPGSNKANSICDYVNQIFFDPAQRVVDKVRTGWNKAEILEGEER